MFGLGMPEMIIIGIIAVMLFGNRLPSVMRSLGSSFVEFKKGITGVQDEVRETTSSIENDFKKTAREVNQAVRS